MPEFVDAVPGEADLVDLVQALAPDNCVEAPHGVYAWLRNAYPGPSMAAAALIPTETC